MRPDVRSQRLGTKRRQPAGRFLFSIAIIPASGPSSLSNGSYSISDSRRTTGATITSVATTAAGCCSARAHKHRTGWSVAAGSSSRSSPRGREARSIRTLPAPYRRGQTARTVTEASVFGSGIQNRQTLRPKGQTQVTHGSHPEKASFFCGRSRKTLRPPNHAEARADDRTATCKFNRSDRPIKPENQPFEVADLHITGENRIFIGR